MNITDYGISGDRMDLRMESYVLKNTIRMRWKKHIKKIEEEYSRIDDHPEYRFFLKNKFGDILKDK